MTKFCVIFHCSIILFTEPESESLVISLFDNSIIKSCDIVPEADVLVVLVTDNKSFAPVIDISDE